MPINFMPQNREDKLKKHFEWTKQDIKKNFRNIASSTVKSMIFIELASGISRNISAARTSMK